MVSMYAESIQGLDEVESGSRNINKNVESKDKDEAASLLNPHEEVKGAMFDQSVLDWWQQQRTNTLISPRKMNYWKVFLQIHHWKNTSRLQTCRNLSGQR